MKFIPPLRRDSTRCILCDGSIDDSDKPTVIVTRGLETLRKCSVSRQDGILHILEGVESIRVHVVCRKKQHSPYKCTIILA